MGAWGPKLYQDDVTLDIKDEFKEYLQKGMNAKEITEFMIEKNSDLINDIDDCSLFWFALADTQWNYGMLQPNVKENAIKYINDGKDLKRWEEENPKESKIRAQVLEKLKEKLNSSMPPEKKIKVPRLYICPWKIGDVFAYQFNSEYSKEKGFFGKYIIIQKIGEDTWWPGHTEPVNFIYNWIGNELPDPRFVYELKGLPQFFNPSVYKTKYKNVLFKIMLISTSKRSIPKNLIYLGNVLPLPKLDKILQTDYNSIVTINDTYHCYWKEFDKQIIDTFLKWENIDVYDILLSNTK